MVWNRSPGEVRWIIKMHQNGISVREIARISRIPKSTVSRIIARAKTPGCPVFGKKRGRKSKLKSWMRASLTKYIKHNRSAILKDLQYMVKQKGPLNLSPKFISKITHLQICRNFLRYKWFQNPNFSKKMLDRSQRYYCLQEYPLWTQKMCFFG